VVLTRGDDYPLHQTPEPVAYAGTDRNFYDRYFFNGYAPDGSGFFAAAFGIYPHLNVCDAHFAAIRDGVQYNLHASRELGMERMDLSCGPIRIEIVEPLQQLRLVVDGEGLKCDLTFTGRAFPIEEPRFIHRIGPRTFMDYTRLTQNGRYTGWIEIDGARADVAPGTAGTRDRSWGVRPVGTRDEQPHGHGVIPGFFWQWTPLNFADRSLFFHANADAKGNIWNTRAVTAPDGAPAAGQIECEGEMAAPLAPGTRWPDGGTLTIDGADGPETLTFEPLGRFQMRGLGYTSPKWNHGLYHGPLAVEREDIELAQCSPVQLENLHVQLPCRVVSDRHGVGIGVFEQLIIGPYAPMGLKEFFDVG
jgi:sarcosine oxidase delta subunit